MIKDLTKGIFGRLVVQEYVGSNKRGQALWKCLCECGNTVTAVGSDLLRGHTKSCGCLRRQSTSERRFKNLAGRIFERLTVQKHQGFNKQGNALWECLCECGNIAIVTSGNLLNGHTKSCGCLNKEKTAGKNSHFWKGGITPEYERIRHSSEYQTWRKAVFERDNYTCQHCNQRGGKLQAHHLEGFAGCKELRFDPNNGQTLCKPCHQKTETYGYRGRKGPKNVQ